MKARSLIYLAPALLFCLTVDRGWADQTAVTETSDAKFFALAERWADTVGRNNPDQLNLVLDENYEHIHGTGLQENRSQFLEALRSGTRKYEPIRLEELRVRAWGDFALVTGKFPLKVEARGKAMEGVNRFCMTMIERPAGWKVLQFQATALSAKP